MKEKEITLRISNIEYQVAVRIILSSIYIINRKENKDISYRQCVAEIILNSIKVENEKSKPPIDSIYDSDDSIFKQYIDAVVRSNDEYRKYYNQRSECEPYCERFCGALKDYERELMATLLEQAAQPLKEISRIFTETVKKINSSLGDCSKSIAHALGNYTKTQENMWKRLKIMLSEIDWDEVKKGIVKWSDYGWTMIDDALPSFYENIPRNQQDADKEAMKYFSEREIELFFNDLMNLLKNQEDLQSAIFCFNNEQYRACALLICSIIDGLVIKAQPIPEGGWRRIGDKGLELLKKGKEKELSLEEKEFIVYTQTVSVFKFLEKLFANGDDFISEPEYLNRNFIMHGMSERKTERTDCIKLFLGLYNVLYTLRYLKES